MSQEAIPGEPSIPEDSFDLIVAKLDPPSIEAQRELLDEVSSRQQQEWQQHGVLAKVVDALPEEDLVASGERTITLGRVLRRPTDTTTTDTKVAFFQVMHTETTQAPHGPITHITPRSVDAAVEESGVVKPLGRFDQADAELLMRHISERESLMAEGFLPNLSPNLNRISGVSGLSLGVPKERGA